MDDEAHRYLPPVLRNEIAQVLTDDEIGNEDNAVYVVVGINPLFNVDKANDHGA